MVLFGGRWRWVVSVLWLSLAVTPVAKANPTLVVDVDSGNVLYQTQATAPWFPASLTKLMTTYVALSAVREGRISLDTPLMVSARAASMAPSKMGFRPGTLVTLDNALKMLMVKSPNDIAVTVAEGVSGSVESFADQMNNYAARLGLQESHFVNPNGLPDPGHVSSARDMAMIGRALLREFPEQHDLFGIGVLSFGSQLIRNHNGMLGRYPGVDGMKTGYTCSAGYNVVLSAQRDSRRLITVVLGAPSNATRSQRAAALFDRYLAPVDEPNLGSLAGLPAEGPALAPDLRSVVCGRGRANAIAEAEAEDGGAQLAVAAASLGGFAKNDAMERGGTAPATTGPSVLRMPQVAFTPVRVFIGPVEGWTGPVARAKDMQLPSAAVATLPSGGQAATTEASDAKEAASPAPLALVGATAPTPAAVATGSFARKAKPLSLRVRSAKRALKAAQKASDKTARGTTPSIMAASDNGGTVSKKSVTKSATPVPAKPKAKLAVRKAAKS